MIFQGFETRTIMLTTNRMVMILPSSFRKRLASISTLKMRLLRPSSTQRTVGHQTAISPFSMTPPITF